MTKLIVFDLDGTISVNPEFYRGVYSGTLENLISEQRGAEGLATLKYYRENCGGKGELALSALNIPFRGWAQLLINAPMELLAPQPRLREMIRSLAAIKVVYTGSPVDMATRILQRLGFVPDEDFDLILGWCEPELSPLKWTCSPLIFENILRRFSASSDEAWAVGDTWDTDLLPAKTIGIKTALVRKQEGDPTLRVPSLEYFLEELRKRNDHV